MDEQINQYYGMIQQAQAANNAWSAEQAQKQMDFQERMSNTAHQREVADLKAAGLNPVLSAGGSGAATTTGAMAQRADQNLDALFGLMNTAFKAQIEEAKAEQASAKAAASSSHGSGYVTTSPVNTSSTFLEKHPILNAIVDAATDRIYRLTGIKQANSKPIIEKGVDTIVDIYENGVDSDNVYDLAKTVDDLNTAKKVKDAPFTVRQDGTTGVSSKKTLSSIADSVKSAFDRLLGKKPPVAPSAYRESKKGNGGGR